MVAPNVAISVNSLSLARVVALAGFSYALWNVIECYIRPRPDSFDNDETGAASQRREDKSIKATYTLQKCFTIVTTSLSLAGMEEVKVMATFRLSSIFILHLASIIVVFGAATAEVPMLSHTKEMSTLHLLWALQALLQPGLWSWMDFAFRKDAVYVYVIWFSLIAWILFGFLALPVSNKRQEGQGRETNGMTESVSTAKDTATLLVDGVISEATDEGKQAGEEEKQSDSGIEDSQSKQTNRVVAANSILMMDLFLSLLMVPWRTS